MRPTTRDPRDYRLVTASAYPGMMAPLTTHPSCICVLSGDADHTRTGAAAALSLEALDGIRRRWRFGDVARLADFVPKLLAEVPRDDRPILLIPPRASVAWEAAVAGWPGQVHLAASPPSVVEPIAEDKIYVREQLRRLGVPVPPSIVESEPVFGSVAAVLGTPLVMQAPSGAGGQGTYRIETAADLDRARSCQPHVERWLLSRFSGELTINLSGVVHVDGVRLMPASVQTSGIPALGVGFGAYCGSDFTAGARLPEPLLRKAREYTLRIGHWLRRLGHRGIFGADIAVDGNALAFLEVNPRVQGSSWLLGCLEDHVAALLGAPCGAGLAAADGSHLLLRWNGPAGVIHATPPASVHIVPGGRVTVSALPGIGITVLPGAILARLHSDTSLAEPGGRALLPATAQLLERLRAGFEITTAAP